MIANMLNHTGKCVFDVQDRIDGKTLDQMSPEDRAIVQNASAQYEGFDMVIPCPAENCNTIITARYICRLTVIGADYDNDYLPCD